MSAPDLLGIVPPHGAHANPDPTSAKHSSYREAARTRCSYLQQRHEAGFAIGLAIAALTTAAIGQAPRSAGNRPDQRRADPSRHRKAIDAGAANGRVTGHVPIQRLTRTEFGAAVNDRLARNGDRSEEIVTLPR